MVNIDSKWPFFFSDGVIKGNIESNVAICSLWSLRDVVTKNVPHDKFAIAGNLYYMDGINYLVRNVLSNPNIRYIILCGVDISKSGDALIRLVEKGVDKDYKIIGTSFVLDSGIPKNALESFRKGIEIIDMRNVIDSKKIGEKIGELKKLPAFAEPRIFEMPAVKKVDKRPSEKAGFIIRDKTISDVWGKMLKYVMTFGSVKKSQHVSNQKELLNVMAVVEDEDPESPYIAPWLWFDANEIQKYIPQVMTKKVPDAVDYTYGSRLRDHSAGDQIKFIIKDLKKSGHSRRAVAVTWQHEKDMGVENPPCLVLIHAIIQDERLYLTCFLRSSDVFSAWPLNAFGFRSIQKEIADALEMKMGSLTTMATSAHVYEHDWLKANDIIDRLYRPNQRLVFDPRGNLVIRLDREKMKILIDHYSPQQKKLQTLEFSLSERGKTYMDIYNKLISDNFISSFTHAADIGAELAKAEIALRYGLKYSQDDPIDVKEKYSS